MTELDSGQKADRRPRKYLWFGYGNYSGQPNIQTPAGNIRDPGLFEELSEEPKTERSAITYFVGIAVAVIALTMLTMLLAWGLSLVLP